MSPAWLFMFLPALVLHEFAHAWAAVLLGDPGPARRARTSLNPMRHLTLAGAVVLPLLVLVLSGGSVFLAIAKPVVVRPERFRDPRWGTAIVALAGPLINGVTGAAAAMASRYLDQSGLACIALREFSILSLALVALNMLPIPPLDGSRIVAAVLRGRAYGAFVRSGWLVLPLAAMVCVGSAFFLGRSPFDAYLDATAVAAFRILVGK